MLRFFDAHVRADALDAQRLENLDHFNVQGLLLAAHGPRAFENGDDLLAYFGELVTSERVRVERVGLRPHVALGVHPAGVPRRAHFEVWRELPALLADPAVVAMGELALEEPTPDQESLLRRQLELAAKLDMPTLISPGRREPARRIRRILELVDEASLAPRRVLINHVDFTSLRVVLAKGCWAGITIGPTHLETAAAADLVERYVEGASRRGIFNTALSRGPADVLALPRVAMGLLDRDVPASVVRRLCWGNAHRFFRLD